MDDQVVSSVEFLQRQAASLLIYQAVFHQKPGQKFLELLQVLAYPKPSPLDCLRAYGAWFQALAEEQQLWQEYLVDQILKADNPFSQQAQRQDLSELSPSLIDAVQHDLRILQQIQTYPSSQISKWVQTLCHLPNPPIAWGQHQTAKPSALSKFVQWSEAVKALAEHYRQQGTGLFARYQAFRWQSGQLLGIAYPDPIRLQDLAAYEIPRQKLLKNTEFLLAGYPALHVLLYGSRGSGKSSLVKALLQEYGDRGLRLVEVSKSDLKDLLTIVEYLRPLPQKFILFVDDLSFDEDEDTFRALKVVLEGNLTARPQNVVVYATSNRRHLVREFFADRPRPSEADEIHTWDTVQEKLSFSDRFGLTLTFEPADQKTYLAIVRHLAELAGVPLEPTDLEYRALQWATQHNGRSGRTARQFIDFLQAELDLSPLIG